MSRNNTRLNWLMHDAKSMSRERQKKKPQALMFGLNTQTANPIKYENNDAYSESQRKHDAYAVQSGQMSPELYARLYGGSAGGSGGGTLRSAGTGMSKQSATGMSDPDRAKYQSKMMADFLATPEYDRPLNATGKPMTLEEYKNIGMAGTEKQLSGQDYYRDEYDKQNKFDKTRRSEQYNNYAVGFKNNAGKTLDATGAALERNDKGEMFGRMKDGSKSALYFSDNQNGGVDSKIYGGGPSISGNQRFGGMAEVENFTNTGQQPTYGFERDLNKYVQKVPSKINTPGILEATNDFSQNNIKNIKQYIPGTTVPTTRGEELSNRADRLLNKISNQQQQPQTLATGSGTNSPGGWLAQQLDKPMFNEQKNADDARILASIKNIFNWSDGENKPQELKALLRDFQTRYPGKSEAELLEMIKNKYK